jgi:oxalate decarboxylase/phosphoglucose isomerase-like protein (cupin superfamily)
MRITVLEARTDDRGRMFSLPLPWSSMREAHAGTLLPGHVRGNHFHPSSRELLVILHSDRWTLRYDGGERTFEGAGAEMLEIEPGCAHAIVNDGNAELQLLSVADDVPVTVRREL